MGYETGDSGIYVEYLCKSLADALFSYFALSIFVFEQNFQLDEITTPIIIKSVYNKHKLLDRIAQGNWCPNS